MMQYLGPFSTGQNWLFSFSLSQNKLVILTHTLSLLSSLSGYRRRRPQPTQPPKLISRSNRYGSSALVRIGASHHEQRKLHHHQSVFPSPSYLTFIRTASPRDSPRSAEAPRSPPTEQPACPAATPGWPKSTTCATAWSVLRTNAFSSSASSLPLKRLRAWTSWPWAPRWTALLDGGWRVRMRWCGSP